MPATNKVTVGMPVHNDPFGLLRSVPTVFNQTWVGDVQLLIVDDGSTDETPEVISRLQAVYGDIDVIRNDDNRGRPFARNQILDNAEGEYLAWLDSGDLWHPSKLETQFEVLAESEKDGKAPVLCTTAFRWVFADAGQERIKVPDVSGDQLYNALTSSLPPYLWTLLGRTSAYRSAGRFDERLPRRQDYEFFVRFIERGGLVVATDPGLPLATYMKTDVGRSPEDVATANRVIRQIHRPLYARYGSSFARTMRRRQLVLEARFYENNGRQLTAAGYRIRGWFLAPALPSIAGVRRRLRRLQKRGLGAGTRVLVRMLRPFLPVLRRLGITTLLRRVVSPEEVIPRYYQELEKGSPPETDVAARLEREIETRNGPASVATWLRLEQAYRRSGQLDSAQSALERGQDQHSDDSDLRIRLVELQALRANWRECVDAWMSLTPRQIEAAGPTTYNRVAWAYRELGQPHESLRVLEKGLDLWPGDRWLLAQVQKAQSQSTDWGAAIETNVDIMPATGVDNRGMITDLGFLAGGSGPVKGWIDVASAGDLTLNLVVNQVHVASTKAAPAATGHSTFSFNCTGLLDYLGDGDEVWCESQGRPVPIEGGGDRCLVRTGYESRFPELLERLNNGYVFENLGKLVEGNTTRRKRATLALYEDVRVLIEKSFGYEVYPMYGNLLGAIRENDFIAHDVGGFDVVYVSNHAEAGLVRDEFASICHLLVDNGFYVKLKPWSAYIRRQRSNDVFVDLNFAWFNESGELNVSYGWRHTPVDDRVLFSFPREAPLGSQWVPVPGNAEALLVQIYGPSWITPNQGYVPEEEMKRDERYLLTDTEMNAVREHNPDLVVLAPDELSESQPSLPQDDLSPPIS